MVAAVLAVCIYFGAINSELLLEGRRLASNDNPQMRPDASIARLFDRPTPDIAVRSGAAVYRPALAVLLRAERAAWNQSPSSFHSMNLVLLIGLLLLLQAWSGRLTQSLGATAAVTVTFAVHPMLGQAVRTIGGQGLLLALIAMIACLMLLRLWRGGRLGNAPAAVLIALGAAVAIGAHEVGLLLPVWLAATWALAKPEAAPAPNGHKKKSGAPAGPLVFQPFHLPLIFGPVVLVMVVYAVLRMIALGGLLPEAVGGGALPFGSAAALVVQRILWPANPTLVYSIGHDASFLPPAWRGWVMLALVAVLTVALWKSRPVVALGLALTWSAWVAVAFGSSLSRMFSEAPLAVVLPGTCLAVGAALQPLYRRRLAPALGLVWLPLIYVGFATGSHWHNATALWDAEARLHPGNPYPLLAELEDVALDPDKALGVVARVKPLVKRVEDRDRVVELQAGSYILANRTEDLDKLLGDEIAAGDEHTPNHMLRLVQGARIKGLENRAVGLLESEYARNPKSFGALYGLADVERKKGNITRALQLSEAAIKNAPDKKARGAALARYGMIIAEGGALQNAEVQLNLALKTDDQQYEAYLYLARVLRDQRKYPEAVATLNVCMSKMNLESQVDVARIMVSILTAQKNQNVAAQWLLQTASGSASDFELNLFAAHYMVEVHRFRDANDLVGRLFPRANDRQRIELWNISAFVAFAAGDYNAAEGLARRVLKADPNHREAAQLLPEILAARRRAGDKK